MKVIITISRENNIIHIDLPDCSTNKYANCALACSSGLCERCLGYSVSNQL